MKRMMLKEIYLFEESYEGLLFNLYNTILEQNWNNAIELVGLARTGYQVPEGTIQETVDKAFGELNNKFKEAKSRILSY